MKKKNRRQYIFNLIEINFPARTYDVISDKKKNINQLTIINGKYFVVMFFLYTFASEITNKVLTYKIKMIMTTIEKLTAIVNDKKVGECFYNLYDRWLDEHEYEDINEYGNVIFNVINKNYPEYGVSLVASTKRPFGIKVKIDDQKIHIHVKNKGGYIVISAKTF